MSQPLSGIIRRRWSDLPKTEYALIMSLADMVDSTTRQWRTTWTDLARRSRWPVRTLKHAGYRLRDARWMQIESTGHGIVITLTPDSGLSLRAAGGQPIAHQKCNPLPTRSAMGCTPVGQPIAPLDNPPYDPPGANAPKRLSVATAKESGGAKDVTGAKGPPLPPFSSEGEKAIKKNGCHPTLSPSERISIEQEINHLRVEINRILDVHYDRRDDDEKAKLKEFKARVDLDCERIGRLPIYRKRT